MISLLLATRLYITRLRARVGTKKERALRVDQCKHSAVLEDAVATEHGLGSDVADRS